jgi:ATP-dependent DNA helicase RecG
MAREVSTNRGTSHARHSIYGVSTQLDFFLDYALPTDDNPALGTPRDIWVRANQRLFEFLKEDRRFERKGTRQISLDELATYYSCFSNTPDGGMIVYGIEDKGKIIGCSQINVDQLNRIES